MPRFLGCCFALLLVASPGLAQNEPERLLSPSTQLYLRWDGVTPHKKAYEGSALGGVLEGPTGDAIRTLLASGTKLLSAQLLAEPLLEGKPPEELRAIHAELKQVKATPGLIGDKGVIVAAEVSEPRPTLNALGKAIGGLFGGSAPPTELFLPDVRVFIIVPDVGDQAESLFGAIRLLLRQDASKVVPLPAALGRKGFSLAEDEGGSVRVAWWREGPHFVIYAGSIAIDTAIKGVQANAAKGGVTTHPLFQRATKIGNFESVTRGFVDTAAVTGLAKRLAGPFVPGLADKLEVIGISNLTAIVFASGFQGKESKALYEFDLPGNRKGLARVFKQRPLTVADLPPLPPDVSRFSMLRVDLPATYDAMMTAVASYNPESEEDKGKPSVEVSQLRKAELERELTKSLGLNPRTDLFPYLGDKIVMFQSPTEGFSVIGTVVCVSVTDAAKVRIAADRMTQALEQAVGQVKVRKKVFQGVEVREIYARENTFVVPTYAVIGDWLVISAYPQPVQGTAMRHKGSLERWRPDSATAARLAKMPADAIGIQYCTPKTVAENLCTIGPIGISVLTGAFQSRGNGEFDPFDIGLIPNGHELGKHLFPNLTYTRDDGKTVRVEVNDSFSLPLEFIGLEALGFAFSGALSLF